MGYVSLTIRPREPSVSPQQPVSRNRLLSLPHEILLMIYRYLVTYDRPISPRLQRDKFFHGDKIDYWCWEHGWVVTWSQQHDPPRLKVVMDRMHKVQEITTMTSILAATCRPMSQLVQAEFLFYKSNVFRFRRPADMAIFLLRIGREKRRSIKAITVRLFNTGEQRFALMLLATCTGLNHLVFDISHMGPQFTKFFEIAGMEYILCMRGLQTLKLTYCRDTIVRVLLRLGHGNNNTSDMDKFGHETQIMCSIAELEEELCRIVTSGWKEDSITPDEDKVEEDYSQYCLTLEVSVCVIGS